MQNHLFIGNTGLKTFITRLRELNSYLSYFPLGYDGTKTMAFTKDELVEILDNEKPYEWNIVMLGANIDPNTMGFNEVTKYFKRLEVHAAIQRKHLKASSGSKREHEKSNSKNPKQKSNNSGKARCPTENSDITCSHCGKPHDISKCWNKNPN